MSVKRFVLWKVYSIKHRRLKLIKGYEQLQRRSQRTNALALAVNNYNKIKADATERNRKYSYKLSLQPVARLCYKAQRIWKRKGFIRIVIFHTFAKKFSLELFISDYFVDLQCQLTIEYKIQVWSYYSFYIDYWPSTIFNFWW